jgi:hypothetical protein
MAMTRVHFQCFVAAAALAVGPVLASGNDQPIDVNTDGLQSHVADQVRAHAANSERALMQYLWFTRKMHHLWLDDVTKPKKNAYAKDEEPREKRETVAIRTHGIR